MIKETVVAVSVVTMAAGAALAPTAASAGEQPLVVASCNPCAGAIRAKRAILAAGAIRAMRAIRARAISSLTRDSSGGRRPGTGGVLSCQFATAHSTSSATSLL